MTNASPPLACPNCHQVDLVQKVTAVVSGGTGTGTFVGSAQLPPTFASGARLEGESSTILSQRLMAPLRPVYQSPWGCLTVGGIIVAAPFIFAIVAWVISNIIELELPARNLLFLAIWVGGTVLIIWLTRNEASTRRAKYAVELPLWEKAIAKWQQLYYCHRCDGVFLPERGARLAPIGSMGAYLYQD